MSKPTGSDSTVLQFPNPKVATGGESPPKTAVRDSYKESIEECGRVAKATSPTEKGKRRTKIRRRGTISLGLLSDPRLPLETRVLLAMEQAPNGLCGWGYERIATATGLTAEQVKSLIARLAGKGFLERVSKGVYQLHTSPAGEGTLATLNDQTGSLWADPGTPVEAPLVPSGGWLEIPIASNVMKALSSALPWLVDSENAEAKAFWAGLAKKSKKLASRLKRDVPGAVVSYLLLRSAALWLKELGWVIPTNVRSPVGALLFAAGAATPKTIDIGDWDKALEANALGGQTVNDILKGGE